MSITDSSELIQHKVVNELAMVQITPHGGAAGVTGSCHPLQVNTENSLRVDSCLFESAEISPEGCAGFQQMVTDFGLDGIKALVVPLGHIEHVGRFPHLLAAGCKGEISYSVSLLKLLPIMVEDVLNLEFSCEQSQVGQDLKLVEQCVMVLLYKQWFVQVYRKPNKIINARDSVSPKRRAQLPRISQSAGRWQPNPPYHRQLPFTGRSDGYYNYWCASRNIVNYLKIMLSNVCHDFLLVCCQVERTIGRQIQILEPWD